MFYELKKKQVVCDDGCIILYRLLNTHTGMERIKVLSFSTTKQKAREAFMMSSVRTWNKCREVDTKHCEVKNALYNRPIVINVYLSINDSPASASHVFKLPLSTDTASRRGSWCQLTSN